MRTVKSYHLISVAALLLIVLCINFKASDGLIFIIGIGTIVVLLLGVHLVLDRQDSNMEYMEKRIAQIASDVESIKCASEFNRGIETSCQVSFMASLESINRKINEMKTGNMHLSLDEIRSTLEDIRKKVEEISVKSPEKREQSL